jgi:hypothetical protein
MLLHIKQTRAPADCPYGRGIALAVRRPAPGREDPRFWLGFPQHTTFLVVETDDEADLQQFLQPGAGVPLCEITPVSDAPVPPNK